MEARMSQINRITDSNLFSTVTNYHALQEILSPLH